MSLAKKRTQFGPTARRRAKPPAKPSIEEVARRTKAYLDFIKPEAKK